MASPDLQLPLENALKSYLTGITLFSPTIPIHAAHVTDLATDGTYLAITAGPPDFYTLGGYNPTSIVTFGFATVVSDPDARATVTAAHSDRVGALIDLLSQQRFDEIKAALNPPAYPFPDNRAWKGIGFDAWEEDGHPVPGNTETQLRTDLNYEFVVHLES